ncbi:MAG: DUF4396 domain-containing protein [Kribbellaceae bacterium]
MSTVAEGKELTRQAVSATLHPSTSPIAQPVRQSLALPGAMDAGLGSPLFWGSLAFALAVAFVVTVPVNRWMIGRGRGHAVVHQHHHLTH